MSWFLKKFVHAGLKLKPSKCKLFAREVEFLGHIVSADGIKTDSIKVKAVKDWPMPVSVSEVKSFIGFCSYYRRFIEGFAQIAKPLHRLTEKGITFVWGDDCQVAFKELKKKLTTAPTLAMSDISKPFILDTDVSDFAIGGVLLQVIDGRERPIAFASRCLTKPERRYCVTKKELIALVHFIKYFRHYVYGNEFIVRTDHGSLRWLLNFKNPEGQFARWIEHRPGRAHGDADGLSRKPCKQCGKTGKKSSSLACTVRQPLPKARLDSMRITGFEEVQQSDPDTARVKLWVEHNCRPSSSEVAHESYFVKSLWNQWSRLAINDGLLCRKWETLETGSIHWQAIVPLTHRRIVLEQHHDAKLSGNLGVYKTLHKVRQRYCWPGLQNDTCTNIRVRL